MNNLYVLADDLCVFVVCLIALAFGFALLRNLVRAIEAAVDETLAVVTGVLFVMIVPAVWAWEKLRRARV